MRAWNRWRSTTIWATGLRRIWTMSMTRHLTPTWATLPARSLTFTRTRWPTRAKVPGHAPMVPFPGASAPPMQTQAPVEPRVRRGLTLAELESQMAQRATPAPQAAQSLLRTLTGGARGRGPAEAGRERTAWQSWRGTTT
ncbi:hypothetical protein DL89DRAFT_127532 [Linderina pennispora]|uniref:Uncharacterized protein n=1 Tax=Linderina pennispora TaxID=61395 RepID=A0A1Y1WDP2_9FUNG|nr:uncharacterized protein DL89DRAFT_127532 [Linderina pennispora]ORX71505.1 hypothetical protein DL89DRAFT_127532 [Linderina pennispora]